MRRAAVLAGLALLLAAGPASAWWIGHTAYQFTAAGYPEQFRPADDGTRPVPGVAPVPFTMQLLPLPAEMDRDLIPAIERAVSHWNRLPGTTSVVSFTVINKEPPSDWFDRYQQPDGRNTIEFITAGWFEFWPGVIAMTVPHFDDQNRILETDIFCNAVDYAWAVRPANWRDTANRPPYGVDAETIITHEMGHTFGLGHSQLTWASMYDYPGSDTRARELTADDLAAMRFLYPASASDFPPPSIWGVVRADFLGDSLCGASYLPFSQAKSIYVYHGGANPSPFIVVNSLSWPAATSICLMGAGFRTGPIELGASRDGTLAAGATAGAVVDPNFARATFDNGAGQFPALTDGSYDLFAEQGRGRGILEQGLVVKASSNDLPFAVLAASSNYVAAGQRVHLDASASWDPQSSPLSWHWELSEAPEGGELIAAGSQATVWTSLPGSYVVRMWVNDGAVDSVAQQAIILATPAPPGKKENQEPDFGCGAVPGPGGFSALGPVLFWLMVRVLWKRKKEVR